MYIEGNALILGDSSYLEHHGILGQKWGVRRFQNKDGTRTAAGKARDQKNAAKIVVLSTRRTRNSWQYQNAVTKAQDKLTNDSKSAVRKMAADALYGERKAEYKAAVEEYDAATNYRYDEYRKESAKYEAIAGMACGQRYPTLDPAKFDQDTRLKWDAEFYMYDDGDQGKYNSYDYFLVAKGENPNKVFDRAMKARNNIESIAKKDADDILGDSKDQVIKGKVQDRTVSDELAYQITEMATSLSDYTMVWEHQDSYTDNEIKQMKEDIKKYSKEAARLGLTHSAMFIEDGTLYLSHHGIRGQRWGVRRFQNRDGSLTNAGRKRLGYATKGAAQTVGKAFKAGVKAGSNAVKAVKAHHEKKEAEKLEKKKEKASKTRLGVMANKDLFTNEEIRKLNERFKLEDEMKMATLQKGVEIAKAVGTIAQNVGTVAKTYEDVTGQSLSPIKRKAAEEKARQDAEDRERRIAREDADEARKAAKEERDIAIHEQTLRKAIAAADTQEFTAQKTKAEADSSVLDAIKKGQDFNGGSDAKTDATGKSWVDKATSDGKNPFDKMIYDRDPDYKEAKDAHDEKVARQERMKYLDERIAAREKEKQAEKEARDQALRDKINQSNEKTGRSKPNQSPQEDKSDDDGGGFAKLKESLPFDKGRYVNRKAAEKARDVKENAEEERTKKQDEKAAKAAIDTIIKDYQHQDDTVRSMNPTKYDREVAASVIKGKAKNALNKVTHPVDTVAKKISDKAREEKWTKERAKLFEEYQDNREKLGTEFANEAYVRAKKQSLQNLGYRGEALDKKLNETPFSKKKKAKHDAFSIQNGVLFVDSSDYLEHHGIRGQRWGVRRFQNPDGTRTEAGKKHDAKIAAKAERKQAKADMKAAKAAAKAKAKDIKLTEKAENLRKREIERYEKMAVKQPRHKEAYEVMSKHAKESDRSELLQINTAANIRGTGQAIVSALVLSTFVPTPIAVAGGIAVAKAMKMNNVDYARTVTTNAKLNKEARERKLKEAQSIKIEHSSGGMLIQDGTLFINAGEPYLEHHGVKGMKWGKHLMAGKNVEAGAGGGFAEDDEKLKEMAKKAGMSVAEFRTKMAGKIGGAASKVGSAVKDKKRLLTQTSAEAKRVSIKDKHLVVDKSRSGEATSRALAKKYLPFDRENSAARPKDTRSFKQKAYDALGGKYKTQAAEAHKDMVYYKNKADDSARRANAQSRAVKDAKKKGAVQDYIANKEGARQLEEEAKGNRFAQWDSAKKANSAQWKYDHSIAGLYDKATGKYKQSHKKTKVPKLMDQAKYYYKEKSNNKLYNNGASKAKTAKEQAEAEVWKAADHVINSHDYYNQSYDPTVTTYGLDTAYRKEAVKYGRLAEGSYRRAAALGKQASRETSTSSRPRARKKKHTSGGSGVTVRRPGRKPVARTKRVTQSSTGVKRRGSTGSGRSVRRGA